MITKFTQYNESIRNLLVGPTKEEMWKNLGYDKHFDTPEEYFLDVIKDIKVQPFDRNNKDSVYWWKNGKTLFEQELKDKRLMVSFTIWTILINVFELSTEETKLLISNMVDEHLGWWDYRPYAAVWE